MEFRDEKIFNEKIPEDVIILIFSYLTLKEKFRYRRVCRYWQYLLETYSIAHQKAIGQHLTLTYLEQIRDGVYKLDVVNDEILRWNCYDSKHDPTDNDIIDANVFTRQTSNFRTIAKHCPNVMSLDIRAIDLRNSTVKRLRRLQSLQCLQINFIKSELKAWFKFVDHVIPKLSHLSISNIIFLNISELVLQNYDPFVCLFNQAKNLESLCLMLSNNNNISLKSLQKLKSSLKELAIFIVDYQIESSYNICADQVFASIFKSDAAFSIEKLRFHCNHTRIYELVTIFRKMKCFPNLNALAISCFYNDLLAIDFCKIVTDLHKLEDLSFYFNHCTIRTLFHEFAKYTSKSISILRLESAEICESELESLSKAFPNIQLLKLVNLHFLRFNQQFFKPIERMRNIKNLHIEYKLNDDEYDAIESCRFNAQHVNALRDVIRNTTQLMEISIINWPGVDANILAICGNEAERRNIKFNGSELL